MRRTARLWFEALEDRCNPSPLGQAWPDPNQLTLSFAPDGTRINGAPSDLFQTLDNLAPAAQWQQIILSAFQTWATVANINIGLVADGGEPFGTDGAVQGDARFGDIRIGMAALPTNLVATTAPFSWTGSTWSGDMILNSSYNFGINGQGGAYDLFTVALHEAGHAFGIPDNTTDPNSVMYANYTGPRTGLDSLDVANIQTLYGARPTDPAVNDTPATATAVGNTPAQLGFNTQLNTTTDLNYYQLTTPFSVLPNSLTVQVDSAGLSLLEPTVSIYDADGCLLATQSATSPLSNDVSVTLGYVPSNTTYTIEVSGASGDVFAIGAYSVQLSYTNLLGSLVGIVPSLLPGVVNGVDHLNDSLASATNLVGSSGQTSDPGFDYLYQANIVFGGDADYYQFTAPSAPSSTGAYALDAIVWQSDPDGLAPVLHLFDSNGKPLAVQVLADTNAVYSMQLVGVSPGAVFYVEVAGQTNFGAGSTGGYVFGIQFNQQSMSVAPLLGSNTLPTATSTDTGVLAMNQNGVFYFELAAADGGDNPDGTLTMTVLDANGDAVASLATAMNAAPRTAAFYLPAGTYTIECSVSDTAQAYEPVTYWLSGKILTDPIGPYYSGSNPPPPSSTTTTSPPANGNATVSSTTTFASDGASVSVTPPGGSPTSMPIPPPGGSSTQSFTTSAGTTTVTMTTDSNGNTTLTLTTPSCNTITNTTTTSGNTTTQTMTTSDGIQVTITLPSTTAAPSYAGSSSGSPPPYYY